MTRAYIGLGSNLCDPIGQIQIALAALGNLSHSRLVGHSRLYRNPPLGPVEQPEYVNAVAALDTCLTPHELMYTLQWLERCQGRVRGQERWGPRIIDLDLLLYGALGLSSAELTVPHPGLAQRDFVLWPLADLDPDLEVPGLGPLRTLMQRCPQYRLIALDDGKGQADSLT